MLNRRFALRARGTSLRTEAFAGLTTFLTMAYIVAVNPAILGAAGMPPGGVAVATCLAAGIGSILMGVLADYPIALAPGMGLNAYFAYTVVGSLHVPWPTALACVFLSGAAFLVLTLVGVRQAIVAAVPPQLFAATAGGVGLFIAFIGLKDAGLVAASPATFVTLGRLAAPTPALALFGLAVIAILQTRRTPGAILIGILATTALAFGLRLGPPVAAAPHGLAELKTVALHLDFAHAFALRGGVAWTIGEIVFVFLFVDLFDNLGTLMAVARRAGLIDREGRIPRLNRILIADSTAAMIGAAAGTTTVTSYVESAAGVAAGGRTGLTAIVTGLLFLAAMAVAPLAQAIPAAATAPALVIVGAMMAGALADIDWEAPEVAIPCFLTAIGIPLTFSIANGLALGITAHAVLRLGAGQARLRDAPLFVLAALFVARFAFLAQG